MELEARRQGIGAALAAHAAAAAFSAGHERVHLAAKRALASYCAARD